MARLGAQEYQAGHRTTERDVLLSEAVRRDVQVVTGSIVLLAESICLCSIPYSMLKLNIHSTAAPSQALSLSCTTLSTHSQTNTSSRPTRSPRPTNRKLHQMIHKRLQTDIVRENRLRRLAHTTIAASRVRGRGIELRQQEAGLGAAGVADDEAGEWEAVLD